MLFRHSISIAQQIMPIYNTTMHKNKINVALNLNVVNCWVLGDKQQATRVVPLKKSL